MVAREGGAHALGVVATPRVEWDAVDLRTDSGIGVEVKSSAYLRSWEGYAESTCSRCLHIVIATPPIR